jgi:hypothetical protein
MNVPDVVLKNVVFIGRPGSGAESDQVTWFATGFFVLVETPGPTDPNFPYLVTVKHVADQLEKRDWCVRINRRDGDAVLVTIRNEQWWRHPTEAQSVDCAVLPFEWRDEFNLEATAVPRSMFVTKDVIENNGIGEGDEVFVVGLFTRLAGTERNIPIVRTGNIAMMPREQLPMATIGDYAGPIDAYLIETRSMGGISGSPVFVRETVVMSDIQAVNLGTGATKRTVAHMGGQFYFLGLNHGHWLIPASERDKYDFHTTNKAAHDALSLGISVVVPAKKILEILDQPGLFDRRERELREWRLNPSVPATTE